MTQRMNTAQQTVTTRFAVQRTQLDHLKYCPWPLPVTLTVFSVNFPPALPKLQQSLQSKESKEHAHTVQYSKVTPSFTLTRAYRISLEHGPQSLRCLYRHSTRVEGRHQSFGHTLQAEISNRSPQAACGTRAPRGPPPRLFDDRNGPAHYEA